MRKLYCYSFTDFKKFIYQRSLNDYNIPYDMAIISICGTNDNTYHLLHSSDQVLNLCFDDIFPETPDQDNMILFNDIMADKCIKFINMHISSESDFYIHCSAGMSRSQAFVSFIKWYCPDIEFETRKENPCIYPNMHVVSMLKHKIYK